MSENTSYSVLVVEDEVPARELLIDYILTRKELRLAAVAKNGADAIERLSDTGYDLVFMDIHLPGANALDIIKGLAKKPPIIFTTAHQNYALNAFDLGAVDFLLKPYSLERFNNAIEKFLQKTTKEAKTAEAANSSFLSFKESGKHYVVAHKDIIYLSSHGKRTIIHTENRDYEASILLGDMEEKLPSPVFIRIHKSTIVNIHFLSMVEYYLGGQYMAYLKDNDESTLIVGRKFANDLKKALDMQ